jgi:recombination protein RecA
MKIGVMFGSSETTTGGNALKFYSSMRLDIRRVGAIKVDDQSVGNRTRVKVVKNKLAPPFTECEFDVLYGEGISKSGDLLDLAVNDGILEKSGAWFSYGGERVGQGRENARTYLQEHPKLLAEIEAKVLQKHGLTRSGKGADAAPAAANGKSAADAASAKVADNKSTDAKSTDKGQAEKATDKAAQAVASSKASEEDAKRAAAAAAANRPRPRA